MISALMRFFGKGKSAPKVGMNPEPVVFNPSLSEREKRNQERIARLRQCIATGDKRPEIALELERRVKFGR